MRIGRQFIMLGICLMLSVQAVLPQDKPSPSAKKNEQVDEKNKKAYEKARKKTLKHRREIQTKETRKRMDETNRRADAYNQQDHKKWYQKIFTRKHPRK
jgi:hypothetical protein